MLQKFNWVDILVIILLFRIGYIAFKHGLPVAFFKLWGMVSAIYLSLHYYTILADWFRKNTPVAGERLPWDFLSFLVLAIAGYLILYLLRSLFCRFIKMEAVPNLDKWGGLVLGIVRGILFNGLIIFMLVISGMGYLKNSVKNSYSGISLFKITSITYSFLWNGFTSKFMTQERFNNTILELKQSLTQ